MSLVRHIHIPRFLQYLFYFFPGRLKERYIDICKKHEIQYAGKGGIKTKEVEISKFAVNMKLAVKDKAARELNDELESYSHESAETINEISMDNLVGDNNRIAFISGITGMGKSVIAKQIVHSWANDKMYKNFKLCIYFRCRELNSFKEQSGNLAKIEMLQQFISERMPGCEIPVDGENLLIVIDDLGELCDVNEEFSIIHEFLDTNRSFKKSSLIITGQPSLESLFDDSMADIGEYKIVDVQALCDEDINEFIEKFSHCCNNKNSSKTKELVEKYVTFSNEIGPMLGVPQVLNLICCLIMLDLEVKFESKVGLFTCIVYAMLRRVYESSQDNHKVSFKYVLTKYKKALLAFCSISWKLYREKRIIFKLEDYQDELNEIYSERSDHEQLFIKNLFIDVSDEFEDQLQFKYSVMMQFLAAIHVCAGNHVEELNNESVDDVLDCACSLYGESMKTGSIVKQMFEAIIGGDITGKAKSFLIDVGNLLHSRNQHLKHIDLIKHLPKDVKDKKFILSLFENLHLMVPDLSEEIQGKLIQIYTHLKDCFCNEEEVKAIFSNVEVAILIVKERDEMFKISRYFKNIDSLEVRYVSFTGDSIISMEKTFTCCKDVRITECELKGAEKNGKGTSNWELKQLQITNCLPTESCFRLVGKWGVSSELLSISNMMASPKMWMSFLQEVKLGKAKGALKLKKLSMEHCGKNRNDEFIQEVWISFIYLIGPC